MTTLLRKKRLRWYGEDTTKNMFNMQVYGKRIRAHEKMAGQHQGGHECGNTSVAAVYDVSLTTVDIKSLLPYITLVAPMDYWLCVSLSVCVFLCSGDNDTMFKC